jgi:hypothetical protein
MRLLEVSSDQISSIKELANSVVDTAKKDGLNRWELAWLIQLSSNVVLMRRLYKGSQNYNAYQQHSNDALIDTAYTFARAYSILSQIGANSKNSRNGPY